MDINNNGPDPNRTIFGGLMMGDPNRANPREETFFQMIKYVCCPTFKFKSFAFIMGIVFIIVYAISVGVGGIEVSNSKLLAPKLSTLDQLGQKNPYNQRYQLQFWRMLTSIFLHYHLVHLIVDVIIHIVICSCFEYISGWRRCFAIYILSGIGANLFSSLIADEPSVGASGALFGIIGGHLAQVVLDLFTSENIQGRRELLIVLLIIVGIVILVGFLTPFVDNWSHLGGLFVGFMCSFGILQPTLGPAGVFAKVTRTVSIVGTIFFFNLGFFLFYTLREPLKMVDDDY